MHDTRGGDADGDGGVPPGDPTLVIGVGNEARGDDGVGLAVARAVAGLRLEGVEVRERAGEATALLDALLDALRAGQAAIVVDAACGSGRAGAIHRFDAREAPLPADRFARSSHAFGVTQAVELGRALGWLPPRLVVYGIEGACFATGAPLSPAVLSAVPRVVSLIRRECAR